VFKGYAEALARDFAPTSDPTSDPTSEGTLT
jgi:hypothetical protein